MTASIVFPVTFSFTAHAATSEDPLAAAMVQTADLQPLQPYAPLTGPLDAKRAQVLAIDISPLGSEDKWVRTWLSPRPQDEVIELAFDAGNRGGAQAAVTSAAAGLLKQGTARQTVAGPVRFDAFSEYFQSNGVRYFALVLPLARGPYFSCCAYTSQPRRPASAGGLMSDLATAQWRKVPADTPDTAPVSGLAEGAARLGRRRPRRLPGDRGRARLSAESAAAPPPPRPGHVRCAPLVRTSGTYPAARKRAGGSPSAGSRCSSPA